MEPEFEQYLSTIKTNIQVGNQVYIDLTTGRTVGPIYAFGFCKKADMLMVKWLIGELDTRSYIPIDSITGVRVSPGSPTPIFWSG